MTALERRLGLVGATAVGVGSMVGAGVFVALPAAVEAGGSLVWAALLLAGAVAVCNAWSSGRLAVVHPRSGGTYVYGSEQLGRRWGVVAGGAFVIGKTASMAVMAAAVGRYAAPDHPVVSALLALAAITAVNLAGVQRSAAALVVIVVVVVTVLAVVSVRLSAAPPSDARLPTGTADGMLEAAALLFFAFAGYARLATLGGEVREPATTIPRAIGLAVGLTAAVYAAVLAGLLHVLGPDLTRAAAPVTDALDRVGTGPVPIGVVAVTAVVSAAGALLSLGLGVSRTLFAMADDGVLPRVLASVAHRSRVPWFAELVSAAAAAALVVSIDVTATITVSSVFVLLYYAITNAASWTLGGLAGRVVAATGLVGCTALALALLT